MHPARESEAQGGQSEPVWPAAPARLLPEVGEIVVLCAPLDLPEARLARLRATLTPREEVRAQRYAHSELRNRWVAARGMLREILGAAAGADPASLRFNYGEHGKPALDPRSVPALAGPALDFNVSHSRALALYGLGRGRELGVDLEFIRPRRSDDVANRFFHSAESAALRALPELERRDTFFALWCCKEAFIKATGKGLSQSMSSFEFALGPRGPTAVRWHREDEGAAARWSVHLLEPAQGYKAALIAEGHGLTVRAHSWPGPRSGE